MTAPHVQDGSTLRTVSVAQRLGVRASRRAAPRFGTAIAGSGAALAVLGGLVVGFDGLVPDDFASEPSGATGTVIMLLLIAAGVGLLVSFRDGPLATAGATASAVALPFLLVFATFDITDLPPFSLDTVLLVSTALWAAAYLVGPGAGRDVYLGAALLGGWLFIVEQVESALSSPFLIFAGITGQLGDAGAFGAPFGGGEEFFSEGPDATTIGVISVLFGIGYLIAAASLDRRSMAGAATPFVFSGIFTLANGIFALGEDLEAVGVGLALAVAGFVVAALGAERGRRGSTWIGAAGVAVGVALVVGDLFEDGSAATIGVAMLLAGALVVTIAHAVARSVGEPGEFDNVEWSWREAPGLRGSSAGPIVGLRATTPAPPPPPPPPPPPE